MSSIPNNIDHTISTFPDNEKEMAIVTLAILKQIISQTHEMTKKHNELLMGNGHPEQSICWSIQNLSMSMKNLQKSVEEIDASSKQTLTALSRLQKEVDSFKNNDANLSWIQWFKKLTMKWLPIMVFVLIGIWMIREPLLVLLKLFHELP